MATQMQAAVQPAIVEEEGGVILQRKGELAVLEFDVVDVFNDEAIFDEVDGGAYISAIGRNDYNLVISHLIESGINKSIAKGFIDVLGENKGKYLANIFGFKPIVHNSSDVDFSDIDILFGKIYMPCENGFTTTISVENSESKKCDVSFKILGVGAGGSKEYLCKITQSQMLHATPVDLVIPAKVKLTRWENINGEYFYTCHLVNISRRIIGKSAINPYEEDAGYEVITQMLGVVDRYDTSILQEAQVASEELEENTKINLNVDLVTTPDIPVIKVNGTATIKNTFNVIYSLPVGFKYATYVENTNNFQHLWAHKATK